VYKGKSYRESIRAVLEDFESNKISYAEIIGAFCVIFFVDKKIHILMAQSDLYHVFTNQRETILTSSFLALIAAQTKKLHLSKMDFLEQFLIGYNVGPQTSVAGLFQVDNLYRKNSKNPRFSFLTYPSRDVQEKTVYNNYEECLNTQLEH